MTRYVIEGRDTEAQPRQTDYLAAGYDPDEDPKPSEWEDGWDA